jgi:K+-transporting ATPase ATPase B chain
MTRAPTSLFAAALVRPALVGAVRKLQPRTMVRNPVMCVTMVGALLTTLAVFGADGERGFVLQLALWLWFTVLFANFAEAMAEGRGKAQANALRAARSDTVAQASAPTAARNASRQPS